MTIFKTLFGIDENDIKETCILMPILIKDTLKYFAIENFSRGSLYGTGDSKHFSLIHTGIV